MYQQQNMMHTITILAPYRGAHGDAWGCWNTRCRARGEACAPGSTCGAARSDGHLDINWRAHANGPPAAPLTTVLRRPRQPIRTIKNWLRLRTATAACDRGHNGAVLVPEPHRSPPPPPGLTGKRQTYGLGWRGRATAGRQCGIRACLVMQLQALMMMMGMLISVLSTSEILSTRYMLLWLTLADIWTLAYGPGTQSTLVAKMRPTLALASCGRLLPTAHPGQTAGCIRWSVKSHTGHDPIYYRSIPRASLSGTTAATPRAWPCLSCRRAPQP